jgi:pyruvate dehydrogenase E1 component alpha subunit
LLRARLLADGIDERQLDELAEAAAREVRAAVQFARQSPMPDQAELFTELWATPVGSALGESSVVAEPTAEVAR